MTTDRARLRELHAKAIQGPYFVSVDDADDCPDHQNSGLAMIDTGRQHDWPVARLCEWPTAKYIAAAGDALPTLLDEADALEAEVARLREILSRALALKGGWREAITELEDHCSEPVRLKNMIVAADQLDDWAVTARAALKPKETP